MERDESTTAAEQPPPPRASNRRAVVWEVFVFQLKLAADGLRDVLLSPISLAAAMMGLIAGGDDPGRYLRSLKALGRRSEAWINLFDGHQGERTSDSLMRPLQQRLDDQFESQAWLNRADAGVNNALDSLEKRLRSESRVATPPASEAARGDADKP